MTNATLAVRGLALCRSPAAGLADPGRQLPWPSMIG